MCWSHNGLIHVALIWFHQSFHTNLSDYDNHQTSNIRRTKSENLHVYCLVLQWSLRDIMTNNYKRHFINETPMLPAWQLHKMPSHIYSRKLTIYIYWIVLHKIYVDISQWLNAVIHWKKPVVTPLLAHCSYRSLVFSHRYNLCSSLISVFRSA